MKSILQEASSVAKAVEKAWNNAGKPYEFSVKVLEPGKKNFFGFVKQPVIISLTYNYKAQSSKSSYKKELQKGVYRRKQQPQRYEVSKQKKTFVQKENRHEVKETDISERQMKFYDDWVPELVKDMKLWIDDAATKINIDTPYTISADHKILRVVFDDIVLKGVDEQRMLFASLAHLLLHGLKKKYKNKFKGFRVIFTTPQHPDITTKSED